MGKFIDETGNRYNRLTVIERAPTPKGKYGGWWKCKCDCGNEVLVASSSLRKGLTNSCGCMKSYGEEKISYLLNLNGIFFQIQKTFETCRFPDTNALARFDFYINNQYLLEFDGEQHFFSNNKGWNTETAFEKTKKRDEYKNQW